MATLPALQLQCRQQAECLQRPGNAVLLLRWHALVERLQSQGAGCKTPVLFSHSFNAYASQTRWGALGNRPPAGKGLHFVVSLQRGFHKRSQEQIFSFFLSRNKSRESRYSSFQETFLQSRSELNGTKNIFTFIMRSKWVFNTRSMGPQNPIPSASPLASRPDICSNHLLHALFLSPVSR